MAVTFFEGWLKNKWAHRAAKVAFAALITIVLAALQLDVLEFAAYDLRMLLSPRPSPSGNVVLVPIEHETLKALQRDPEALDWTLALQKIAQAQPAQVVSLVNPSRLQGSFEELSILAETALRMPFQFGENDLPKTGVAELEPLPPPFQAVPIVPAPTTVDRVVLGKDGVSRRLILTYENQFTMHARLAQAFNGIHQSAGYRGTFPLLGSTQILTRYRNRGAYPSYSFIDVVEDRVDPEFLRGKIVLIGRDTREAASDYVTTPLNKELLALSQLEMHANILDTLIKNDAPRISPDWIKYVLTFLISLLTIHVVLSARPSHGLMLLASAVFGFIVFGWLIFAVTQWVLPMAHPLLAVFICYYFVIPYRLIVENRRSWEYYQKNRLLTQVEELKSNFLRMMSHDLKTPLARIQGMADLIRKENLDKSQLSETQRRALATISESSEELTEFIGSILSLSRIESKEMKLQLRSRDINQLLRAAIRKYDYLAKRKNIEIVTELEPLFSIRVDEDLLRTVFSNLIENAIKYSSENGRILVTTEETDSEVVIQVADQGRGISSDDLPRVFDRFYRAQNSRNDTAGNGLGLYLTKYFVELHNGRIEVESELNKGSTFTVRLPMSLQLDFEDHSAQGGLYV